MCRRESFGRAAKGRQSSLGLKPLNKALGFRPPRYAGIDPSSTLHDRTHRLPPVPCAAGGRPVARTQGRSARSSLRERHLARCRWFGGHPRRSRTCRGRAPMPDASAHARAVLALRCAAPPAPAPLRCLHAEDRASAPRHARMWCDALLACAFVYGGCRLLKPALCSVTVWGTPGRRHERARKLSMARWNRPPVHLSSRWAGRGAGLCCRPLGGAKV